MEEVLLGPDPCEESAVYEAPGPGAGVVGQETGQRAPRDHDGGSAALQLNLAQ